MTSVETSIAKFVRGMSMVMSFIAGILLIIVGIYIIISDLMSSDGVGVTIVIGLFLMMAGALLILVGMCHYRHLVK